MKALGSRIRRKLSYTGPASQHLQHVERMEGGGVWGAHEVRSYERTHLVREKRSTTIAGLPTSAYLRGKRYTRNWGKETNRSTPSTPKEKTSVADHLFWEAAGVGGIKKKRGIRPRSKRVPRIGGGAPLRKGPAPLCSETPAKGDRWGSEELALSKEEGSSTPPIYSKIGEKTCRESKGCTWGGGRAEVNSLNQGGTCHILLAKISSTSTLLIRDEGGGSRTCGLPTFRAGGANKGPAQALKGGTSRTGLELTKLIIGKGRELPPIKTDSTSKRVP